VVEEIHWQNSLGPKMISAKSAAILVLFMCTIHLGTSLKCYMLLSGTSDDIGTETNCTAPLNGFCQKTYESSTGIVMKNCQAKLPGLDAGCTTASTMTTCLCDTDLCNGSETIGIKPMIAIITAMLTIFFGKMF